MWTVINGKLVFVPKIQPYRRPALLDPEREPRADVVSQMQRNHQRVEVEE